VLLPVCFGELSAQTYPFKNYSTADGLAHVVVRKIFQDSRGFLWFGTHSGISRYDGNEFVSFLDQDSLKSEIYDIWEDRSGTMWFATYGRGLAKQKFGDTTFVWASGSDGVLAGDYITCIFQDNDQNIWIGSGDGLTLMKPDGSIKIFDPELGQGHGEVYAIAREKDGILWIGTHRGLLTGKLECDDQLQLNRILDKPVRSLCLLKDGDLLAGTSGGGNDRQGVVCRFHNGIPDTLLSYPTTQSLIKAQTLLEDSQGRIWIGTEYGVYLIDAAKITHLRRGNGLFNENIYDIMEDREGTIWFGTENGVMKLVAPVFSSYGMTDGLSGHEVLCMLLDRQQNLWLGMWNGLNRIKPDGQIQYWDETQGLWHHTVNSLAEDEQGNIWIGTQAGLNRFSSEKILKKAIAGFSAQRQIWSLDYDSDSGLWLAMKGMIIKLVQGRQAMMLSQPEGVPDDVIAPLLIDDQKRLWFGTQRFGAGIYQNDAILLLNRDNGLPGNQVHCIFQRQPGEIWIGTDHGPAIWSAGHWEELPFSTAFLENKAVYFILQDSLQHLWLGTDYGLYEWTGKALHHFTTREGLASDIVPNGIVTPDGSLWFGTRDGISFLSQSNRLQQVPVPRVYLDGVLVGDNAQPVANHSVIGYNDRSIVFQFNALSFVDERATRFQWRLTGIDKNWIEPLHQRRVRYTNLAPGKYTFQVRTANRNGAWSVPAQFDFRIQLPYWKTGWFFILVLAFLATILFLIDRYRINQLRKIETMRTRIAADLHDDIASSLASVSLYSEVIQRQLQNESEATRSLLNRIRDLSREVMENISTIVWTVDPRHDEFSDLIQYFQRYARPLCITAGVTFMSHFPAKMKATILTPEQRRTVYLILKEGLANVLRHADCSQVEFSGTFQNHIIELSLRDNGQGFDMKTALEGHGLLNMKTRARTIGANLQIISEPGAGTVIHLRLRIA
jgi:ligand-binding sensor domain-containing protein/two-component sensor histidine kinase